MGLLAAAILIIISRYLQMTSMYVFPMLDYKTTDSSILYLTGVGCGNCFFSKIRSAFPSSECIYNAIVVMYVTSVNRLMMPPGWPCVVLETYLGVYLALFERLPASLSTCSSTAPRNTSLLHRTLSGDKHV